MGQILPSATPRHLNWANAVAQVEQILPFVMEAPIQQSVLACAPVSLASMGLGNVFKCFAEEGRTIESGPSHLNNQF